MGKKTCLVLSKREWDRISRKQLSEETITNAQRDEHLKKINETSQNWIKSWPDSMEGQLKQLNEKKRLKQSQDMALIKSMSKKKKQDKTALEKAKQMIFDTSCYGRELISAVYESKAIEEREAQIKFKAKAKEEVKLKEEEEFANWKLIYDKIGKQDEIELKEKKLREKELVEINKILQKMKIVDDGKDEGSGNIVMTQKLIEDEARQEKAYGEYFKDEVKKYALEQKALKEQKAKREQLEDSLVKLHKLELDRRNCKIREVLRKVHHEKHDTETSKKHYQLIKNLQDEEQATYDIFVGKGMKRLQNLIEEKDKKELAAKELSYNSCYAVAQHNKNVALEESLCKNYYKCTCDRQTLFTSHKKEKVIESSHNKGENTPLTFLQPSNKKLEELKEREKGSSPWSGTQAAHAHFAQRAAGTLAECTHKFMARKVVDSYRKSNCLDEKSLPVANYFG